MTSSVAALGIDLGASLLHLVGLDSDGHLALGEVVELDGLGPLLTGMDPGTWVAIDAPDEQREPRHLADADLSRKFQPARCAEVALGRRGYWVPWVTPPLGGDVQGWMQTGFDVWRKVRATGLRAIEVYPYAAFQVFGRGGKLAKKSTREGLRQRIDLLENAGFHAQGMPLWSHDGLDAAVAAVVARDARAGTAEKVLCEHLDGTEYDGSAIWLPASRDLSQPVE